MKRDVFPLIAPHPRPLPSGGHPLPRSERGRGKGEGVLRFMGSPLSFFACIGTMNQIGTPLPALSPQGGERVAEGRERGGSWSLHDFRITHRGHETSDGQERGQPCPRVPRT